VLMIAMTSATETPNCGRARGCQGCYGGSYGGCSGWGGGCYGGGCYGGGCYGGGRYGGGCYGGGGYSYGNAPGGYGYATFPDYAPYTGAPGTIVTSPTNPTYGTPQMIRPEGMAENATSAQLSVKLPASAQLAIDGRPTTSTGESRQFVTPPLEQGKDFTYVLTGKMTREGKEVRAEKKVTVRAGRNTEVTLEFSRDSDE
jgi:uncharacterized protein (TIGR03000 family)